MDRDCRGCIFPTFFNFNKIFNIQDITDYPADINAILEYKKVGYTPGTNMCTFNTSQKMEIGARFQGNIQKGEKTPLGDFIQIGDSISKKQGSDSVFVYRNEKEYVFVQTYFPDK